MKTCFYFCSYKIFQPLNINGDPLNFYNHKGIKKENSIYLFPEENSPKTINPENFFNIKKEVQLTDLVVIDRIYSKADLINVDDHINRTGLSYLRGKTPYKNLPSFVFFCFNKTIGSSIKNPTEDCGNRKANQ